MCPHCGSQTAATGGACAACGRRIGPGTQAPAATLTPLPPESEGETRLGEISPDPSSIGPSHSSGPLQPGDPFGSRYRILRVLGAGGMGVVYQAWDEELAVAIALKVIRPEVMSDPYAAREVERRFKRELLLARQVTHHNVVRIHDLGEVGGVKYLTMPFVEGENLAARLTRVGKLDVSDALRIARQVAGGLEAAHAAGVVHRDLKPENVMLENDGQAIIMDFGISRSMTGTGAGTAMGAVVGTLEYMSPEQGRGEQADDRSDIYSLGLILYDMVVGRRRVAASGGSAVAEMMTRVQHAPPAARALNASIPEPVDRILGRCLAPDPKNRYQTVTELLKDFDALDADGHVRPAVRPGPSRLALAGAALLVVAVAATGAWWAATRSPVAPVTRDPVSVLIADFENRTGDSLFQGSLEQALGIAMEGARFITTYPRRDAVAVAGQLGKTGPGGALTEEIARLVSQRQGIKVILAGSIDPEGGGFRVSVRAVDAVPGTPLATASKVASSKPEVLQAVAAVASQIREALGDATPESEKLAAAETFTAGSLEAAHDFSLAQQLASAGKDEEAVTLYKRALERDPNFGRAYAAWGVSASKLGRTDESAAAYEKAFQLMDRMTEREKYRTLGTYFLSIARNYEKAIENYTTLVDLYPADRAGHSNLAFAYFHVLNFPKALAEARASLAIYPMNATFRNNSALYAMYAGDFATAAAEAARVIEQDASFHKAYLPLAMAALAKGDIAAARTAYDRMMNAGARGPSLASAGLADLAMYEGRFADAPALLRDGIAGDEKSKNIAGRASKYVALAEAYLAQGRTALAIEASRSALQLATDESVAFPVARVYLEAGREREARDLGAALEKQIQPRARAYGKLIAGEIALRAGRTADALQTFREARQLADLWAVRFDLGVAYVAAGHFAEALSELEACVKRQGEATAMFLEDVPSFRYMVPVRYWLGRAQEGLGMSAPAAESYKAFLARRSSSSPDPLAADARRRLGAR